MTIKAPDVTLSGTFTDDQGNVVNGTLTFTLGGFGATVPNIAGVQMLPGLTFTTTVSAGTFSTTFYSNQIISPGPLITFYNISFQSSTTTTTSFNFSNNYQFSAGTFDISQLIPLTGVLSNTSLPNTVTPHTFASVSHQFLNSFTSSGNFTAAQPAASDLTNGTTGSGAVVLATSPALASPTMTTPTLGVATGTSLSLTGAVISYNGTSTAGQGVPPIYAITSQKSETQAADANVLTFTPPATVGTYRISVAISVSAATAGVISYTVTWTDSNGNAQSNIAGPLFQYGTAAPNTTFTTSAAGNYKGDMTIDVNNAAANIVVKWVGGGTTTAKMSVIIERLI